jgi:hypothetical protein
MPPEDLAPPAPSLPDEPEVPPALTEPPVSEPPTFRFGFALVNVCDEHASDMVPTEKRRSAVLIMIMPSVTQALSEGGNSVTLDESPKLQV